MYQNRQQISKTRRQWRYLSSRLRQWAQDGSFAHFSTDKQQRLRDKLRRLLKRMRRWESASTLRKALGGAVLLLGLGAVPAQAQVTFGPAQFNPFGLTSDDNIRYQALADVDGDGDLDIISLRQEEETTTQFLELFENQSVDGGVTAIFAAGVAAPFAPSFETVPSEDFIDPEFADLDGDGDLDLLIGENTYSGAANLYYWENVGTAESPMFGTAQTNPFGIDLADTEFTTPNLADMDGDGDLDLLSTFAAGDYGSEEFGLVYQENTGTANDPMFGAAVREFGGLPASFDFPTLFELGDIDNDGDVDVLAGNTDYDYYDYSIDYQFYENAGDAVTPDFSDVALNPFNLEPIASLFLWPLLGDLDNDGDLDVLNGLSYNLATYENGWTYQENLLQDVAIEELADELTQINVFPTVSAGTFNLQLRTETEPLAVTLSVYDQQGRLLQQRSYPSTTQLDETIRLHDRPAGTYHLKLQHAEKQWTGTVIKQ